MRKKLEEQVRELEERLEALIIAVPNEEAAYHFYLDLANRPSHEGTRKMFLYPRTRHHDPERQEQGNA